MQSLDLISSDKTRRILSFLVVGGLGTGINVLLLYLSTAFFGLWYIASATLSFILAHVVSFFLHKFWVFSDNSRDQLRNQAGIYFVTAVLNLMANTAILYALVEYAHVWYLFAQVCTSLVVAVWSFLIYGRLFNRPSKYSLHSGN